jgi:hypothetical protein
MSSQPPVTPTPSGKAAASAGAAPTARTAGVAPTVTTAGVAPTATTAGVAPTATLAGGPTILPVAPPPGPGVVGTIGGVPPTVAVPATPVALTVANSPLVGAQVQPVTVAATSGTVTFQLVVYDDFNTPSAPVTATVTIQAVPTAVLAATPAIVGPGGTITLSGAGSTTTGSISKYAYSLVSPPDPPVL